jgi:hypothetical protein
MSDYDDDWGFKSEDEFEATEAQSPRGPWPAGKHVAVIEKAERKATRANGSMLSLTFRGEGGECDRRLHWENLNLWHDNPQVREIALSQLKSLLKACGLDRPPQAGYAAIEGLFLTLNITHRKRKDNGELEARASFEPIKKPAAEAPARPAAGQRPGSEQPAAGAAPKWARKPAKPADDGDRIPF